MVRRARTLRLLGEDADAKRDEETGRALLKANLGPTRWPTLRLEADLARLAFWGGDFVLAQRLAESGLRVKCSSRCSEARFYELRDLQGQLSATHGLSTYVIAIAQPDPARAQLLRGVASELWIAERLLGSKDYDTWASHAGRAAAKRSTGDESLPAIPSREPRWARERTPKAPDTGSCGPGGGLHRGAGKCRGATCEPPIRERLLATLR